MTEPRRRVHSLGEALHYEFKTLGVYVTVLATGFTNTPVLEKLGFDPKTMPMKPMSEPTQLADSMRVVRRNTIAIAEDIPEAQYDYRPVPDSRSVRETLLHMDSMTFFDFHTHEEQRRTSMDGFAFRGFFAGLPTNEKRGLSKGEILAVLRDEGERWCKWVEGLPKARAAEIVTLGGAGPGGKSRFEMLIGTKEHEIF
jgi:hypothetical protein